LDCKIIELTDEFGKNIHYHLHEDELQSDNSSEHQNGFDIIMRSARSIPTDSEGKQFIIALSEALWYIDIHDILYESRKPFDASELNFHCQTLILYTTSTWIRSSKFNWLYDAYDKLIVAISNYVNFLHRQWKITASNYASEVPIRSIEKATSVNIYDRNIWINSYIKSKYKEIKAILQNLPPWKLISLEEYLPTNR
ncbi:23986_t:CDS:2, partial [Gigaspora rosea]